MSILARIKNWIVDEIITSADLNAEFDNIINNLAPEIIEDFSDNIAKMQTLFELGDIGSENLPVNLSEELGGLRSMVKKITGEAEYYVPPGVSLSTLSKSLGTQFRSNRIVSGFVDGNNQPQFLQSDGATLDMIVKATVTPLVYIIDGSEHAISADDTITLPAGPVANNTAAFTILNNTAADTVILGEREGSRIQLLAVGIAITARVGLLSLFKTFNGTAEYMFGIYRSDALGDYIENCFRAYGFDSGSLAARVPMVDTQVITLLALSYIFIKDDETILTNTNGNEPVYSYIEPALTVGNYWFDLSENKWKVSDGLVYSDANVTLIGISGQDGNSIQCTRSFDFGANFSSICDIAIRKLSDSSVGTYKRGGLVSVMGQIVDFGLDNLVWNMATDIIGPAEAADTLYYAYLTDSFEVKIETTKPYDRGQDLKSQYHPHKPWRAMGHFWNNAGSNIDEVAAIGSEDAISDHSISTKKMRPYIIGDPGEISDQQNFMPRENLNLIAVGAVTDTSSVIRLKTSGRPVLILVTGGRSVLDGVSGLNSSIALERRSLDDAAWVEAWGKQRFDLTAGGGGVVPASLTWIDTPPAGDHSYRIVLHGFAGNNTISGLFQAFEI